MGAQAPRHIRLPVVLHGTGLDGLDAGDAGCGGGDGERLAAERPRAAARCLPGADAEVQRADGLADDGGYRLAEGEEGDREPGGHGDLRDRGRAAAFLPQHVADSHPHAAGHPVPASRPLRAARRSSQPEP